MERTRSDLQFAFPVHALFRYRIHLPDRLPLVLPHLFLDGMIEDYTSTIRLVAIPNQTQSLSSTQVSYVTAEYNP